MLGPIESEPSQLQKGDCVCIRQYLGLDRLALLRQLSILWLHRLSYDVAYDLEKQVYGRLEQGPLILT